MADGFSGESVREMRRAFQSPEAVRNVRISKREAGLPDTEKAEVIPLDSNFIKGFLHQEFREEDTRKYADVIMKHPLIEACARGEEWAIKALMEYYYRFVKGFGEKIDAQMLKLAPQIVRPMISTSYGQMVLGPHWPLLRENAEGRASEEGHHATIWHRDTLAMGIDLSKDRHNHDSPASRELIRYTNTRDMAHNLMAYHAVEKIAGALSHKLLLSKDFMDAMERMTGKREWPWGAVHDPIAAGNVGASLHDTYLDHADIDLITAGVFVNWGNPSVADKKRKLRSLQELRVIELNTQDRFGAIADAAYRREKGKLPASLMRRRQAELRSIRDRVLTDDSVPLAA